MIIALCELVSTARSQPVICSVRRNLRRPVQWNGRDLFHSPIVRRVVSVDGSRTQIIDPICTESGKGVAINESRCSGLDHNRTRRRGFLVQVVPNDRVIGTSILYDLACEITCT